ncbi:hypothetical protein IWQ60_010655 [Tieghemiomyces parasiticus]|uniref:Uncharacterized protein n=1 Tax=Tieghemiomyces parasiticus TaxID=78921 RepID=A0A9W7ZJ78_9FUNG|nr:hypothetical protein IWQ60_010655 [Tieghemiomyces parasiticus]
MVFTFNGIPDLTSKRALLISGTYGLNMATSIELARQNAHVFLTVHTDASGTAAVQHIQDETSNLKVKYLLQDLSSLKSVYNASQAVLAHRRPLHELLEGQFGVIVGVGVKAYRQAKPASYLVSRVYNHQAGESRALYANSNSPGFIANQAE